MGRPKKTEPKQQYTVMLQPSIVKEIDKIAEKLDLSRSEFMANLIRMGLDDAKILDSLKVLDLMKSVTGLAIKLKSDFISGRIKKGKDGEIITK